MKYLVVEVSTNLITQAQTVVGWGWFVDARAVDGSTTATTYICNTTGKVKTTTNDCYMKMNSDWLHGTPSVVKAYKGG